MAYGLSISQHRDRDSHFYHFDGTKSVRRLTDDTGVEADKYAFDAFGNETSSSGSTANSQRYKGEYLMYHRDPDAGPEVAYALHHRHYEPETGTFSSRDPAKDDLNLYRYVKNNPLNSADPSGLQEQELLTPKVVVDGSGPYDKVDVAKLHNVTILFIREHTDLVETLVLYYGTKYLNLIDTAIRYGFKINVTDSSGSKLTFKESEFVIDSHSRTFTSIFFSTERSVKDMAFDLKERLDEFAEKMRGSRDDDDTPQIVQAGEPPPIEPTN